METFSKPLSINYIKTFQSYLKQLSCVFCLLRERLAYRLLHFNKLTTFVMIKSSIIVIQIYSIILNVDMIQAIKATQLLMKKYDLQRYQLICLI